MADRQKIVGKPERPILKYGNAGSGVYPVPQKIAAEAWRRRIEEERADPDLARKRAKEASDLSAKYARMNGRPVPSTSIQERLLDELKDYARTAIRTIVNEVIAAEHNTAALHTKEELRDECRDRLLPQIWDQVIPQWTQRRPKEFGHFQLGFSDLKSAIWTEGTPSIEDLANAAIERIPIPSAAGVNNARGRHSGHSIVAVPIDGPRIRGYRREVKAWMVQNEIKTQPLAAERLGVSYAILKSIVTSKGKVRHGRDTLTAVLKKIGFTGE